ncbi:hypothetical protein MF271_17385 (plasmid) [Deinococcus sp. KNUC1210]|uniref:hypothetical protein n=1 Tax=Deinococcus sp. KNUC1210 TaxID=2917691 RepID=UPI001EEFDA73|nr:hypothetical protein [Deinococcus sp. KNUC1210]ULH16955.1 hypothetical protein MF271_17385 [Deinococcus sp. KNUC1210]
MDGQSSSIDVTVQDGGLYVPLLPFLQALGGGARPSGFDYNAGSIVLTRGDGSKTVKVAFKLVNQQPTIDVLQAARGLGFQVSESGTVLTLSSAPSQSTPAHIPVTSTPATLYPNGFSADEIGPVARQLVDELNSTSSSSAMLQAVLDLSGVPVYGTPARPADGDLLEAYLALHHPFSTVLELFTLRTGFQFRLFTPIDSYLSSLNGKTALTRQTLAAQVSRLFEGPPSRSQVVLSLVGAIGRERVARGISGSKIRDPFFGDDLLDPVQLRLLSAVLEAGQGPDSAIKRAGLALPNWTGLHSSPSARSSLPVFALERRTLLASAPVGSGLTSGTGGDDLAPKSAVDLASKVADKAVSQIVKETYPEGAAWMDNTVQDGLGIPIVLPVSQELLEAALKGDPEKLATSWAGAIKQAITGTLEEGARVMVCGSVVLYGYHSRAQADPATISHRTDGNAEGPSLSKVTATLVYDGDYRDRVFKTPVRYASRLAVKKPLTSVGELLDRLGCELPQGNAVAGKPVEWELTGDLADHLNGEQPEFADPATNAGGVAHAQFRAVDEKTPKSLRAAQKSATGNLFIRFKNLLPQKWWLVQAAAQFGQDTSSDTKDTGKVGSSTQRLTVRYYEPPKLTLKFQSDMHGSGPDTTFNFMLDASIPLKAEWNGDPSDPRSKFIGYSGTGSLHYESRSFSGKCNLHITGVQDGTLEVKIVAESFESPQLTVIVNPGFSIGSVRPTEDYAGGCQGAGAGGGSVWFGAWLDAYGTGQNKLIGVLPGQTFAGVILRGSKQSGTLLLQKVLNGKGSAQGSNIEDTTTVSLQVTP